MRNEKYPQFSHSQKCIVCCGVKLCIWVVSCGVISLCTNFYWVISMHSGIPLWPMATAECVILIGAPLLYRWYQLCSHGETCNKVHQFCYCRYLNWGPSALWCSSETHTSSWECIKNPMVPKMLPLYGIPSSMLCVALVLPRDTNMVLLLFTHRTTTGC
jgi:hypothetical protein